MKRRIMRARLLLVVVFVATACTSTSTRRYWVTLDNRPATRRCTLPCEGIEDGDEFVDCLRACEGAAVVRVGQCPARGARGRCLEIVDASRGAVIGGVAIIVAIGALLIGGVLVLLLLHQPPVVVP